MKLYFEQTPEHLKSLRKNSFKNNKLLKALLFFIGFILTISFVLSLKDQPFIEAILSFLLPLVLIIGIWFIIAKIMNHRIFKNNKETLFGWREVELTEEKIHYKTSFSDTNFSWEGCSKLDESDSCYFIYLGTRQAIIIPKYAFENESQKTDFLSLVKSKINIK